MKFVICYWTDNPKTDFIEEVFAIPPVEKYLKDKEFYNGHHIHKRPHSFVSFELNVDRRTDLKLSSIINGIIKNDKLEALKGLKSFINMDVAFKVVARPDEEFPAFYEDDLSFLISISNWMTFKVDNFPK